MKNVRQNNKNGKIWRENKMAKATIENIINSIFSSKSDIKPVRVDNAVNIDKQAMSAIIEDVDTIIRIPQGAIGVKGKSGKAHFELKNENGNVPIPHGAMYVQYTDYRDERPKFIEYGEPTFYDEQGNMINDYF